MTARILFGFHAVGVRLKTAPRSVLELHVDPARRDARMQHFVARAVEAGVKLVESSDDRLAQLAGSHRHQGVVARVEPLALAKSLDPRHHALVAMRAGQLRQPVVAALDQLDAGLHGSGDEVLHARVAPRRVDMQLEHRARRRLQAHAHRMEAEKDARRHRPIVAALTAAGRASTPPRRRRRAAAAAHAAPRAWRHSRGPSRRSTATAARSLPSPACV